MFFAGISAVGIWAVGIWANTFSVGCGLASCTKIGDVHRKVRNPELAEHPYLKVSLCTSNMLGIWHDVTLRGACTGIGDPL